MTAHRSIALALGASIAATAGFAADLPSRYEPTTLAALVHTISDGIAVQAAAGRSHDELRQIGDVALRALLD